MKLSQSLLLYVISGVGTVQAAGSVATDGTVGSRQTLNGPNFNVPETLGRRSGTNLFHSFTTFNLDRGETATFTGSSSIRNVISRVTGGQTSTIDGTLRSEIGKADMYFINPAGVVFGPNATVDVPAALHVSTADKLKLSDGGLFNAAQPQASRLTKAPPAAFGFTSTNSVTNGLLKVQGSTLAVKDRQRLDLVGRGITITDKARLQASGGEARLVSVDKGVDVAVTTSGAGSLTLPKSEPGPGKASNIQIKDSTVTAQGNGAGRIALWGKNVSLSNSKLDADNDGAINARASQGVEVRADSLRIRDRAAISADSQSGAGKAGKVKLSVDGTVELLNRGKISSGTFAGGNAGGVELQAGQLRVDGGANAGLTDISSRAEAGSTGNAGKVDLNVTGRVDIRTNGQVSASSLAKGAAGSVTVDAGQLRIKGNGDKTQDGIFSRSGRNARGRGGEININVTGFADLDNGGKISTDTSGAANAGAITVKAGRLRVTGGKQSVDSEISSIVNENSTGRGGEVNVVVGGLAEIARGGAVTTSTSAKADAGTIRFTAEELRMNGGAEPRLTEISSRAEAVSKGSGGTISLNITGLADLRRRSQISTTTFGTGKAGSVDFHTGQLRIRGSRDTTLSGVFSQSLNAATGDAGAVNVIVNGLASILNGGRIASNTEGSGNAGSVFLQAQDLSIQGQRATKATKEIASRIQQAAVLSQQSTPGAKGNAGQVRINVFGTANILDGGVVSSNTAGKGQAGEVTVKAKDLNVDGGTKALRTEISSRAQETSQGDAGVVTVEVEGTTDLRRGGQINSSTRARGKAGAVVLNTGNLDISSSPATSIATGIFSDSRTRTAGSAGNVAVTATHDVVVNDKGVISSSTSSFNQAGNVSVTANNVSVNHGRIKSSALSGSEAPSGRVTVTGYSSVELTDNALVSVQNDGAGSQSLKFQTGNIDLTAPRIDLHDSKVTATSVGKDIAAGNINLTVAKSLLADPSSITTESSNGSGGDITINGAHAFLFLKDSNITTSVSATSGGDGGNITVQTGALVLDRGQIRADTAGTKASGGRINLENTEAIIASRDSLQIGNALSDGNLNVIQASAPNGINGEIRVNAPQLNLSGAIANIGAPLFDNTPLSQESCLTTQGSTLIRQGNGGLPGRVWSLRRL